MNIDPIGRGVHMILPLVHAPFPKAPPCFWTVRNMDSTWRRRDAGPYEY